MKISMRMKMRIIFASICILILSVASAMDTSTLTTTITSTLTSTITKKITTLQPNSNVDRFVTSLILGFAFAIGICLCVYCMQRWCCTERNYSFCSIEDGNQEEEEIKRQREAQISASRELAARELEARDLEERILQSERDAERERENLRNRYVQFSAQNVQMVYTNVLINDEEPPQYMPICPHNESGLYTELLPPYPQTFQYIELPPYCGRDLIFN
jgi:hypothetical protein